MEQISDKMLARKDGAIGHMIFNNPEKHNAVSLAMWASAEQILADFAADDEIRDAAVVLDQKYSHTSPVLGGGVSLSESRSAL